MCPICLSVMVFEGLIWLSGILGIAGIYKWIKAKHKPGNYKECKCKNNIK